MNKKKVISLYRVSTKMQVRENDIPMQKAECTRCVEQHADWVLYEERSEKGVSGFKNTAKDRDVLNEIMERARKKEFDILLVYMSDRLGRREDDTPFFVAELNRLGIEVWSVKEGQLKTQEHIDKLLNYIRFWNAEGESLKTSDRVRDAQLEMLKHGEYTGGGCPYGYNQVYSGKYNNKGRALKRLEVNQEEAEIVQKIYELSTNRGQGGYRIAQILNQEGIPTKKDSRWTLCTVNNILRNPIYKGYYTYGKGKTKGKRGHTEPKEWIFSEVRHPELAIIEEGFWDRAQKVREARTPISFQNERGEKYPAQTHGRLLLMGLAYCGYCGGRLSNGSAYDKWTTKDGIQHRKIRGRYKCITKSEGGISCTGKINYRQEQLEETVLEAVYCYINRFKTADIRTALAKELQRLEDREEKELQIIRDKLRMTQKDITTLKNQLPQAIRGEFMLSAEEVGELIAEKKQQMEEYRHTFLSKRQEGKEGKLKREERKAACTILSQGELFRDFGIEEKKLFLFALIDRIEVRENEMEIRMRICQADFVQPSSDNAVSTSH